MAIARGTKASGGTDFVTGYTILADEMNTDLNTIVSGVNNITIADANVVAGANIDPSKIGDYSASDAEYKTTAAMATRPAAATPTDNRTFDTSKPTDMEGEVSRIRYALKSIFGITIGDDGLIDASEWYAMQDKGVMLPPTGTIWQTLLTVAPDGWLILDDGTIGDGSSSATHTGVDYHELFCVLFSLYTDAQCPMFTSAGAAALRATDVTADVAWAAHRRMSLPAMCGRVTGIAGTPRAGNITDSYRLTATGGTTGTIVVANEAFSPLDTDDFDNYTVKFTGNITAALTDDTATISAYDKTTSTFSISAISNAPASGDTFDIYRTVTTRAVGTTIGIEELVMSGQYDGAPGGAGTGAASGWANGTGKIGAHPPTIFLNWMVKL